MPSSKSVRFEKTEVLPVSPEDLWSIVSNTEHLNRMVGMPAVRYGDAVRSATGFYRSAEARAGLFRVSWEESPFEWVRPEWYQVRRRLLSGPIEEICVRIEIKPGAGSDSQLRVVSDFTPRNALGRWVTPLLGKTFVEKMTGYFRGAIVTENSENSGKPVLPQPGYAPVNRERLAAASIRLAEEQSLPAGTVRRLLTHVETASDEEVLGMRPFALADRWETDRDGTLRSFLHGTRAGLLEMEWQLLCPACRVPNASYRSLADLKPEYHCSFCNADHLADLDRSTELRFNVAPAVRRAAQAIYCVGNPGQFFHILAQQFLLPGEQRPVRLSIPGDRIPLRLRVLKENHILRLDRDPTDEGTPRTYVYDGTSWSGPDAFLPAGPIELVLENRSPLAAVIVLERLAWDEAAVTASLVTTMEEFRAYFGSEVLAPGREVAVRQIALLFTDLKASTALYERVGDAPAFGRVQQHFDFLTRVVAEHGGARVKTIGDAVMAAFHDPSDALRAALLIQAGIDAFNRAHAFDPPIIVKIGVHSGSAIAVNANGALDYFGRTVNLAARVQNESYGGDVVCLETLLAEPGIAAVVDEFGPDREPFSATLRGISGSLALCRLRLPAPRNGPNLTKID
ncbi:MAG TPA: DUF5939 domain-containing protein [Chthoniobacterales bacterium]